MTTIIETIYENGVFRPLTQPVDFQEHQRYRLTIEPEPQFHLDITDPILTARIAERTIVLPNGRTSVNLLGIFDDAGLDLSFEEIEAILDESRRDQQQEWDELYGTEE